MDVSLHQAVYQTRISALHHYYREQQGATYNMNQHHPRHLSSLQHWNSSLVQEAHLLLPLVDLVQEGLQNLLHSNAWLSFNIRDQLLVTHALVLMEYRLRSTIFKVVIRHAMFCRLQKSSSSYHKRRK